MATNAAKFWDKVDCTGDACWLWKQSLTSCGYGQAFYDGKVTTAHRVAWQLAYGPIPTGLFVCHKCDVRPCARPDHLFLGTNLDNVRDMVAKGRVSRSSRRWGEAINTAKVDEVQVQQIRLLAKCGFRAPELAKHYGLRRQSVQNIIARRTWKHL